MTNEEILIQLVLELSGDNGSICDMMHDNYNQCDWCEDNCGKNGGTECSACVKRLVLLKKDTLKENSKQSLIERIDEIRANSVTDEDFKRVWGKSIDESVAESMKHWDELEKKVKDKIVK